MGVCGTHCGDAQSIHFFDRIGVDCISCTPLRVPGAKVAAAQAHIEETASKFPCPSIPASAPLHLDLSPESSQHRSIHVRYNYNTTVPIF